MVTVTLLIDSNCFVQYCCNKSFFLSHATSFLFFFADLCFVGLFYSFMFFVDELELSQWNCCLVITFYISVFESSLNS